VKVRHDFDPTDAAPHAAREVVDRLQGAVPAGVLDDLRLVVSELVTNAVRHGPRRAPVTLSLTVTPSGVVRGEVADQGDGVVEIRAAAGEGGGWGLQLVDRMTERWGVYPGSTHVWFELSGSPTDR
jgi:anti-sigma regulatory factor (Ser/Thr protein kinase)